MGLLPANVKGEATGAAPATGSENGEAPLSHDGVASADGGGATLKAGAGADEANENGEDSGAGSLTGETGVNEEGTEKGDGEGTAPCTVGKTAGAENGEAAAGGGGGGAAKENGLAP